jgi:peptide chain release factor
MTRFEAQMTDSMVNPDKERMLSGRMLRLGIRECDLRETFIRGSGKGGQKINKTSSCVHLLHAPSGAQIKCQQTRSRALNRFLARRELCDRIEARVLGAQSARQQAIEKIRRQKRRRSRRARAVMLEGKHLHALKKQRRHSPGFNED